MIDPLEISEETFYNKELCDAIRTVTTESPMSYDEATILLNHSDNFPRDMEIMMKLSTKGISDKIIRIVIGALNNS